MPKDATCYNSVKKVCVFGLSYSLSNTNYVKSLKLDCDYEYALEVYMAKVGLASN